MIRDWSFSPSASVPGGFILLLVEVAEKGGICAEDLLRHEQISLEDILDHEFRVSQETFEKLISRAIGLTGQFGLGFQLGLQMKTPYCDLVSQAVRNNRTLRDTVEVCLAFSRFQSSSVRLEKTESPEEVTLHFKPASADYDPGTWAVEILMMAFASVATSLVEHPLKGRACVMIDRPVSYERIRHLLPGPVEFGCREHSLTFTREAMDYPIIRPDTDTARAAKASSKQELGQLRDSQSVGSLVEEMVFDDAVGLYSMEEIASKLNISTRSLQRHLKDEGLVFSDIVENKRRQQATRLLAEGELSVSGIAAMLGYSDVANFSRAFRRWSGESPREYRQRVTSGFYECQDE